MLDVATSSLYLSNVVTMLLHQLRLADTILSMSRHCLGACYDIRPMSQHWNLMSQHQTSVITLRFQCCDFDKTAAGCFPGSPRHL